MEKKTGKNRMVTLIVWGIAVPMSLLLLIVSTFSDTEEPVKEESKQEIVKVKEEPKEEVVSDRQEVIDDILSYSPFYEFTVDPNADNTINATITNEDKRLGVVLLLEGSSYADPSIWEEVLDDIIKLSKIASYNGGFEITLENPSNKDKIILWVADGHVLYDVMKEEK